MTEPLFIHIPKSAGMSVRHGLKHEIKVAGNRNKDYGLPGYAKALEAYMEMRGEHHGRQHARWRDVCAELKSRPAFAVVRNPWARVASRYFFARFVATQKHKPEHVNYDAKQSFDSFLEERHTWGGEPFYWHRAARGWYPALDYVTDSEGEIRCTILRCEHLAEDLWKYRRWKLPPRRRNVTINKIPYQELYTNGQRKIVEEWYACDIETFGITFDGCATRNVLCEV